MNRFHLTPLVAALAMAGLAQAGAPTSTPTSTQLPTGGSVVAGTASIASTVTTSSASMTITQSSQRAVVDWTRFDVGSAAQVSFVQPSASSVTLNRVLGSNPSQIFGRISANGQVFLTNPSGVYFAPGSSVDVGGLVATTHSISNDAFMAGSNSFSRKGSTGTVQNDGTLTAALGGYIALLAPTVRNQGVVVAKLGTVAMAAGETFNLQIEGGRTLTGLEVTASTVASLVDNGLAVQAPGGLIILSAQALDRVQGGVVNNSGVLQANGLVNDGGRIMLRASNKITHSGSITADAASAGKGGTVTLIADLANLSSRTEVNGSISAKGGDAGGDGGFIETSASKVRFGDNMVISTLAAPGLGGKNGTWLIDPTDFTIAASGGDMTGTALGTSLASGNVTIYSTSGASGSDGDINVNEAVSWSANTLTLNAQTDINVNAAMTGSGTAKLAFQYGQSAVSSGNSSTYNISAAVSLPSGSNFSTQLGTDGTVTSYTVITSLGSAGDESLASATNSLQGLAYSTRLSGNYVLGADIAASGTSTWNSNSGFSPIGDITTYFTGTFDGLGHTVSGLTINRTSTDLVGLFGLTGTAAVIKNVGLTSGSIIGRYYVGSLAGFSMGTISNSYATGTVSGSTYLGGLVGALETGTISSSYATGAVSGTVASATVGGLVGQQNSGTITGSYASGAVSGTLYAGGLVGNAQGTITSSYATGAVSGSATYAGGLVGALFTPGSISSSYATGAVTGTGARNGGLAGLNSGTISSSYATGTVSSSQWSGGLVGLNSGTLSSVYATGASTGSIAGGLAASQDAAGTTSSSYATGSVTGTTYAGGLMGTNTGTVSTSYASGAVGGSGPTGGLLGALFNGATISDSYATGAVSSGTYRGGLVGWITAIGHSISNSYATGVVSSSGATNSGGLVGRVTVASTGSVSNSFWNSDNTSSAGFGSAGTGLSSTAMKTASNFSAWSISSSGGSSSTWRIYDGSTSPLLRTFLTSLATDTSTTYTGAVQYGIGYGLSNISGTVASGTNAGTYTSTLYSNQQGYDLSGSGTLTILVPTSSSVGSSTAVLEPDSEIFPLPSRGLSAVLTELDSVNTGGEDQSAFDLHQASGG
jgi:filamentous hemagglutinin family protein